MDRIDRYPYTFAREAKVGQRSASASVRSSTTMSPPSGGSPSAVTQGPCPSSACNSSRASTVSLNGAREVSRPFSVSEIPPASTPGTVCTAAETTCPSDRSRSSTTRELIKSLAAAVNDATS